MVEQCQDNLRDHRQVLDEFTNMFEDALHRKDWDFCCEYRGVTIVQPIKQPPTPPIRPIANNQIITIPFLDLPFEDEWIRLDNNPYDC